MSKLRSLRPVLHRILVVEDDPQVSASLQEFLETCIDGCRVDVAPDGADGLAAIQGNAYDLIISDYRMPRMDGLAFLAEARRLQPTVPRILITAYPELSVAMKLVEDAAISNFMTKPIGPEALLEAVNAAGVKRRRAVWTPAGRGHVSLGELGSETAS